MIETLERWLKRLGVGGGLLLLAAYIVMLAWTLPSHVLVVVTGTETQRRDVSAPEGESTIHDVRYVMAQDMEGSPRMFRNEDTGWGWPPYLKFDSGNVAAQAQSLAIDTRRPTVELTYYGFRIPLFSMFPNVLDMDVVEPDHTPVPWLTIIVAFVHVVLIGVLLVIYRDFKRAREERSGS